MSHLVVDAAAIKQHHRKNFVEPVRVIGAVLDYDPINACIAIKSLSSLSHSAETLRLTMDDDLLLSDPQLCYVGTVVDVSGLYDGATLRILSIRVIDVDLDDQQREDLHYVANLKNDPL